ncbi:MAG: hypothetical protein HC842_06920 [Cytophagales bacterium]|nr:hypothetical protein [Cytophagales bacterium]
MKHFLLATLLIVSLCSLRLPRQLIGIWTPSEIVALEPLMSEANEYQKLIIRDFLAKNNQEAKYRLELHEDGLFLSNLYPGLDSGRWQYLKKDKTLLLHDYLEDSMAFRVDQLSKDEIQLTALGLGEVEGKQVTLVNKLSRVP